MILALIYVGISVVILALLSFVYVLEDIQGRRILLPRVRERFDAFLVRLLAKGTEVRLFFTHGFLRLLLHYGVHSILKRIQAALRRVEKYIEALVRKNRTVAKEVRATKKKTHLEAIAKHKEEVALSDAEKQKRRSR